MFFTTKDSDVSSANKVALDAKSSDKLFIYVRKSNGPSREPSGTPVLIVAHQEYCTFRTTFCFC